MQNAFKAVLLDKTEFFSVNTAKNLDITRLREAVTSDYLPVMVKQFSVVDLDHDDISEVILWLALEGGGNDEIGFMILRYQDEAICGYTSSYRAFHDLKPDGTFMFSGGAFDWGIGMMLFTNDGWETDRITYCESDFNAVDTEQKRKEYFFVNHKDSTAEEFETATDEFFQRENVVWYNFTVENVETIITA